MKKKGKVVSVSEKIMKVMDSKLKTAEEIKQELKDSFGHSIQPEDIRINLLRLLRREMIKRKKEDKVYKYYV